MAVTYTENGTNTPNGSHLEFTYTFPTIKTDGTDVNVSLDGQTQATSKYTVDDTSSPTKITFNNTSVDFGNKAYIVEEEEKQTRRQNALIYSGVYNA